MGKDDQKPHRNRAEQRALKRAEEQQRKKTAQNLEHAELIANLVSQKQRESNEGDHKLGSSKKNTSAKLTVAGAVIFWLFTWACGAPLNYYGNRPWVLYLPSIIFILLAFYWAIAFRKSGWSKWVYVPPIISFIILFLTGLIVRSENEKLATEASQRRQEYSVITTNIPNGLSELATGQTNILRMLSQLPALVATYRQEKPQQGSAEALQNAYEELAKNQNVNVKVLQEQLPRFARTLIEAPNISTLDRANAAYVVKDYNESQRLALVALDEALKASPPKMADAIAALDVAGISADLRIQYFEALSYFRQAKIIAEQGVNPGEEASQRLDVAYVLAELGNSQEAEKEYREALAAETKRLGPNNPRVLSIRNSIGLVLDDEGKLAEAEKEYQEILPIQLKMLGPEHPDTLATRNNLGRELWKKGNNKEAEKEFREILEIASNVLGLEHPESLVVWENLAVVLQHEGKHAEAEAEFRKILPIKSKVFGLEHPDTLATRQNLAFDIGCQGKYVEWERENREILMIEMRVLGPEHPRTLSIRHNLATALAAEGKLTDAEKEFRETLMLRERVIGQEHPDTLNTSVGLAMCLFSEYKMDEAKALTQHAFDIAIKTLGTNHPTTLDIQKFWQVLTSSHSPSPAK